MKIIILVFVLFGLLGCAPEKIYRDNFCLLAKPITGYCYVADDKDCSEDKVLPPTLLNQIELHNMRWCGACDKNKCED